MELKMVREDLVASAVSFLQDPTVAAAALDKRIAFLQSKNLSQEEINTALARASDTSPTSVAVAPPQAHLGSPGQQMRQPLGYGYELGPYQGGPWTRATLEPPRRDWRDWFIMATVTSGVGYGLYAVAKRYVMPLISPPTPPQLEADKASIDASFNRAFALIERLTADTTKLQISETERTEKLDSSFEGIDSMVEDLKAANLRREAESKVIADQVQGLKELVPKALQGWKASGDAKMEELSLEVQSLKRLLENKVGRSGGSSAPAGRGHALPTANGNEKSSDSFSMLSPASNGATPANKESLGAPSSPAPGITSPKQDSQAPSNNLERGDRRAAIPAWQMAAAKKSGTANSTPTGEGNNVEAEAEM